MSEEKLLRCSKCKEEKPTTEFHKDNSNERGYQSSCKSCSQLLMSNIHHICRHCNNHIRGNLDAEHTFLGLCKKCAPIVYKDKLLDCRYCGKEKPIEEFTINETRKRGFRNFCKDCYLKYQRSSGGKANYKKYDLSKKGKVRRDKNRAKALRENPVRAKLQSVAQRCIKIQGVCEICKEQPAKHRHHEDYSKPLEVMLVCPKCHYDIHRRPGEIEKPPKKNHSDIIHLCSWCDVGMKETIKAYKAGKIVSHTICQKHSDEMFREENIKLNEGEK